MTLSYLAVNLPIWVMYLLTVSVIFIAFEGGFHLGRYWCRRSSKEKDSLTGAMVGAILGLLAFMLSFSFGVAASHFDSRRHLVLDEANAIRTAYTMTDLLSETSRVESKKLLHEYVDLRVTEVNSRDKLNAILLRSNKIQDQLWAIAMAGEAKNTGASSSWLYVQSLTEMNNIQAKRIAIGLHTGIQTTIWIVLFGLAIFGIAAMGYNAGLVGIRGFFSYQVLILAFALVMMLIYDLDRPHQGLFKVSQGAMVELHTRLSENASRLGGAV
jgi:hypothetical protein